MACEKKADEEGPEATHDVSNTWSAMSLVGHIGSAPGPSVSLLTSEYIQGMSQGSFANQVSADKQTTTQDNKVY